MSNHIRSTTIDAPIGKVWEVIADLEGISQWVPTVKTSHVDPDASIGLSTSRTCTIAPMGQIQEEVVRWEPQSRLTIDIVEFKKMPMMRTSTADFQLRELSPDTTEVSIEMSYKVGLGVLGAATDRMVLQSQMVSGLEGMVAGLKHHIETGGLVNTKTKLPFDAVR